MTRAKARCYTDRGIRPFLYVGLGCTAAAAMRWGQVGALGAEHHSEAWTVALFWAGVALVAVFAIGWLVLTFVWKEKVPTVEVGHGEPREMTPSAFDVVSTSLLSALPLMFLNRVNETVEVADGYYSHAVVSEWTLPAERDATLATAEPLATHTAEATGTGGDPLSLPAAAAPTGSAAATAAQPAPAPRATYMLPLIRLARTRIIDNLRIESGAGEKLSACNTEQFVGIVRGIIEYWAKALHTEQASVDIIGKLDDALKKWRFDAGSSSGPAEAQPVSTELVEVLKGHNQPPAHWQHDPTGWMRLHNTLVAFCDAVSTDYIIFVPVDGEPGGSAVVRHSFTREHRPRRLAKRDRLRYWLGLRPHKHELGLSSHIYAQSYHLDFRAPYDQYVASCAVEVGEAERSGDRGKNVVVAPLDGSGARDYAHIYVRPAESPAATRRSLLRISLDCREKPPGLIGIVALVAVAQALLIWIIGKFYGQYFPDAVAAATAKVAPHAAAAASHVAKGVKAGAEPATTTSAFTDVPALLLALPGVAAAWLGAQFTGERLRSTSLATVLGVFYCGGLAIASTSAAVSRSAGSVIGPRLGIAHPVWVALMILSALLAVDLSTRTFARCVLFANRIHTTNPPASILV